MIDEALFAILTGSPKPTPEIPTWYTNAAAEGTVQPYGVFERYGSPQVLTQDRQVITSCWRYRFTIIHESALVAAQQMKLLCNFLTLYTDSPVPGIMRFIQLGSDADYLPKQKYHRYAATFDIMENLTS